VKKLYVLVVYKILTNWHDPGNNKDSTSTQALGGAPWDE
jgi:hypothetical protein